MPETQSVMVSELFGDELADLRLTVLTGENHLDNPVTHPRVQKPGLAFAGYYEYIKPGRVQIVGESELEYLKTVEAGERRERLRRIAPTRPRFQLAISLHTPDDEQRGELVPAMRGVIRNMRSTRCFFFSSYRNKRPKIGIRETPGTPTSVLLSTSRT